MTMTNTMLRPCLKTTEHAVLHLIMCPFAGGSSGAFRSWRDLDDLGVEVSLVIYPGRDHRMRESCIEEIDQLADQLAEEIRTLHTSRYQDQVVLLAGHSMGAQVAFETCARLEQAGVPPAGLVLSGCHAPHLRGRRQLSHLDDQHFIGQLVEIGGCSPELLADPALLSLFLPLLRADFRATETYHRDLFLDRQYLHTPTLLLYGSNDDEVNRDEVQAWQLWLDAASGPVTISGDHFYITRRPRAFLGHVMHCFASTLTSFSTLY